MFCQLCSLILCSYLCTLSAPFPYLCPCPSTIIAVIPLSFPQFNFLCHSFVLVPCSFLCLCFYFSGWSFLLDKKLELYQSTRPSHHPSHPPSASTNTRAGGEGSPTWSGWCVHCCEAITLLSIATNIISYTLVHPFSPITNSDEMKMKPYRTEGSVSAALTALWLALVATPIGRMGGLMVVMMIAAGVLGLGRVKTSWSLLSIPLK